LIVIKLGGNVLEKVDELAGAIRDVGDVVVVHGGGPVISEVMERMGLEPRFVKGLRVTDENTLEVVLMTLAGLVNKRLVAGLIGAGIKAVGISGADGPILVVEKRTEVVDGEEVDLGLVGDPVEVRIDPLVSLLDSGYVPVLAPLGVDREGTLYNVNADTAAGAVASALDADEVVFVTDVPGVLEDVDDPSSVIDEITVDDFEKLVEEGVVKGGMIPKVEAAIRAVEMGCVRARITNLDGLREGKGTVVRA